MSAIRPRSSRSATSRDAADLGEHVPDPRRRRGELSASDGRVGVGDVAQGGDAEVGAGLLDGGPPVAVLAVDQPVRRVGVDDHQSRSPRTSKSSGTCRVAPSAAVEEQGVAGAGEHRDRLVHAAGRRAARSRSPRGCSAATSGRGRRRRWAARRGRRRPARTRTRAPPNSTARNRPGRSSAPPRRNRFPPRRVRTGAAPTPPRRRTRPSRPGGPAPTSASGRARTRRCGWTRRAGSRRRAPGRRPRSRRGGRTAAPARRRSRRARRSG